MLVQDPAGLIHITCNLACSFSNGGVAMSLIFFVVGLSDNRPDVGF